MGSLSKGLGLVLMVVIVVVILVLIVLIVVFPPLAPVLIPVILGLSHLFYILIGTSVYVESQLKGIGVEQFATPHTSVTDSIPELKPLAATEGAPMWRSCGRRARVSGVVIWASELRHTTEDVEVNGFPQTVDRYSVDVAIAWGQAFGGTDGAGRISDIILVEAGGKVLWKKGKESQFSDRWDSFTNHLGGASQAPDSFLESQIGSGRVAGYRNTAISVIENWKLADFGNAVPIAISATIQPDDQPYTIADAITDIWLRRPGASADEIDVSQVTGRNVIQPNGDGDYIFEGFQTEGPQSIAQMLEQFIGIFDLTVRHSDGKLQFTDRGSEAVVSVDAGHLGCAEGKAGNNRPLEIIPLEARKIPSSVAVAFYSKGHGYQRSSEPYAMNDAPAGENILQIKYDGVLLPKQARRVAKRRLMEAVRVGDKAMISGLPPDYVTTEAGDVLAVPFNGQRYYVRAQIVTVGANYLVQAEGVVEQVREGEDQVLTTAGSDIGTTHDDTDSPEDDPNQDDPEGGDDGGYIPPLMRKAALDLPPLFKDKEAQNTGVYYAHCAEDPHAVFKGAKSYLSWKNSGGFKLIGSSVSESGIGIALNALGNATSQGRLLDRANTLRVQFFEGSPSSATRAEVESGANWAAVGDPSTGRLEVIGFLNAEAEGSTATDYTAQDIEVVAPDTIQKTGGTSFVTAGAVVGAWARFVGLAEAGNESIFRKIVAVSADSIQFDVTAAGDLVDEGPVPDSTEITFIVDAGVYVLSGLFRGKRDTREHIGTHAVGDLVVLLDPSTVVFDELPKGKLKKVAKIKDVPKGKDVGDVVADSFTFTGESMRPFRPAWFKAIRDVVYDGDEDVWTYTGDVAFSWVHRTRFPFPDPTTTMLPPHDLDHEGKRDEYVIKIYADEAKTTLLRTIEYQAPDDHDTGEDPGRRSHTYTIAQQTADGILGVEFWLEIWQVGAVVKKGRVLDVYVAAA